MKGPNIQMPGSMLLIDQNGNMSTQYAALLASLAATAFAGSRSGTSTERPTAEFAGRYVGMPYFDESLGLDINLKTPTPHASTDVWVRYDGTQV